MEDNKDNKKNNNKDNKKKTGKDKEINKSASTSPSVSASTSPSPLVSASTSPSPFTSLKKIEKSGKNQKIPTIPENSSTTNHTYYTRGKSINNNNNNNNNKKNTKSGGLKTSEKNDNENDINVKNYRQLLAELFPSKYIEQKVNDTDPTTKLGDSSLSPTKSSKNKQLSTTTHNTIATIPLKSKNKILKKNNYDEVVDNIVDEIMDEYLANENINSNECSDDSSYTDVSTSDDYSDESSDDYSDESSDNYLYKKKNNNFKIKSSSSGKNKNQDKDMPTKFNIIFTVGGDKNYNDDEYDDDYDIDDDYDSDYSDTECSDDTEDEDNNNDSYDENEEIADKNAFINFHKMISNLPEADRNSKVIKEMVHDMNEKETEFTKTQEKRNKKKKLKNTKKFSNLLKEKNVMNDVRFFKENMSHEQQLNVIKQIEEIKKFSDVEKPYRLLLIESDIPTAFKACAYKKINTLKYMEPGAGEYYKIKNWVDTFMQIPFNKYKSLPITYADGVDKCHDFMENAKQILDNAVYGLNDAKLQIMQMIGQLLVNPTSVGTAIAIKGPMGTGKTTLIKDGISKILGRDFAFIALGGATDSSFLEGHSYTYEGSSWGKIVDFIIRCKCMNPVIYFDELDKVSDTPRGEEIIGILTHLTDTTQNNKFHDKYFAEIDFDLSRCLFIFSYNDESKVNPILRDRMYRIHTKGYDQDQKTIISNNYLLPTIQNQVKFNTDDIVIPKDTLHYIITNHTDKEDGVRNLKRCLEIIHTKLNLYRLMKPGTNLFENDLSLKVEFPLTVTNEMVDQLIKKNNDNGAWLGMYS